jgi:hypothetical protein
MGQGYGYKVCYDCIGKSGCRDWCTCQSQCICCGCRTVADLRAEQHRLQAHDADSALVTADVAAVPHEHREPARAGQ